MKSALVTGANKGIGLEVAKLLAQHGFFVYLGSRNLDSGQAAVQQFQAAGLTTLEAIQLDVTSPDSIRAARAAIGEKTPVLDVLVNNAGISGGMSQSALHATLGNVLN
jgi:NAD(P)-dependent dehydrogenase (short-subunit alcohol dehydrogenase family)